MIVCLCHRISDRDIAQSAQDGTPDFEALQDETCIARNCGCCEDCARQVFEQAQALAAKPCTPTVPNVAQVVVVHRPRRLAAA